MSKFVQIDFVVSIEAMCDIFNANIYQRNKSRNNIYIFHHVNEMQVI